MAHELASQIWLAVLDSLEENEHTFCLLKTLAQEGDVSNTIQKFVVNNYTQGNYSKILGDFMNTAT